MLLASYFFVVMGLIINSSIACNGVGGGGVEMLPICRYHGNAALLLYWIADVPYQNTVAMIYHYYASCIIIILVLFDMFLYTFGLNKEQVRKRMHSNKNLWQK